ncbi:ankyrin [Aspergillus campestris IBT 28561]|uniref:Ankyrin n=1 Tax=Aspergillus campestris (strain IBT 28561) TaxID=1392248 RepID=A0A2I1D8L5_ASPC2|nr:ankyrin [Aspergillus campestris IBT 28561]PKY06210.1 ankyrin [Aspergillus campestris IBT 28561]
MLSALPLELLFNIVESLPRSSLAALARTEKGLAKSLTPQLYNDAVKWEFHRDEIKEYVFRRNIPKDDQQAEETEETEDEFSDSDEDSVTTSSGTTDTPSCAYAFGSAKRWHSDLILDYCRSLSAAALAGTCDDRDWTLVHVAAQSGNIDLAEIAISKGIPLNGANHDSDSRCNRTCPLVLAIQAGHEAMVWWLIEHGANVTGPVHVDGEKGNILSQAASYGSTALLRHIIEAKRRDLPPDDVTFSEELSRFGLCYAVLAPINRYRLPAIRLLLDEGANPCTSHTDDVASTPVVVLAALNRNLEALKLLLDRGADINSTGRNKTTALMNAVEQGYDEMVHLCLDRGADPTACQSTGQMTLSFAGESGLPWDTVQRLFFAFLDAGGDLNSIEAEEPLPQFERTGNPAPYYLPLHSFVATGRIPAVRLLLRHGADPLAKGIVGATALHVAMNSYNKKPLLFGDIVKELVDAIKRAGGSLDDGVTTDSTYFWDPRGSTALHIAARQNALGVLRVLLTNGADATTLDSSGRSALDYATQWRNKKCVDLLSKAIESHRVGAN